MHGCSSYLPDFYWFYPQINSSQLVYKYKRGPRKMDTSHIIGKSKISNFGSPVGCLAGCQLSVTCWNNLTHFINNESCYLLSTFSLLVFLLLLLLVSLEIRYEMEYVISRFNFWHKDQQIILFSNCIGVPPISLSLQKFKKRYDEMFLQCMVFLGFLITRGCWKEIVQDSNIY